MFSKTLIDGEKERNLLNKGQNNNVRNPNHCDVENCLIILT